MPAGGSDTTDPELALEPRVGAFLIIPLTSRLHPDGLPGNVRLSRSDIHLPEPSVANVYDVQKVLRRDFVECLGLLPVEKPALIEKGLRLVFDL